MQERFMVRTSHIVDGRFIYQNTLAEGRAQAVKQAERIGKIDADMHRDVRAFLEGHLPDAGKCVEFYSSIADGFGGLGIATIYSID